LDALVGCAQVVGVGEGKSRRAWAVVGCKVNRAVVRKNWYGGGLVVETLDLALAEEV
jgi:hypothetical protein